MSTATDAAHAPLGTLLATQPRAASFLQSLGLPLGEPSWPLLDWLEQLADEDLLDAGLSREQILAQVERFVADADGAAVQVPRVDSLTIIGGHDKHGRPEPVDLTLRPGEVVAVVGPTGAGKSRLLSDIECFAQGDTPSGRRILVNGQVPDGARQPGRGAAWVAQLSQSMNFVVDMAVGEFITMHARCRERADPEADARDVIARANALAGEPFGPETPVTQLSGGQARALMIADVALLSAAPVVLIDEIENAGVDRQRALDMLIQEQKIVLISTHDPLLALRGKARIVVRGGGIAEILDTSKAEVRNRACIESLDQALADLRHRLRQGGRIDEVLRWSIR